MRQSIYYSSDVLAYEIIFLSCKFLEVLYNILKCNEIVFCCYKAQNSG